MKNKKLLVGGLLMLLVIGIISVVAVSAQTDENGEHFWGKHKFGIKKWSSHFGLSDHSANLDKFKEKLDLPENATKEDFLEALKEKKGTWNDFHATNLREKLGLSENATDEEVQQAWQEWRDENKDSFFGHGKRGFGHKRC